jgi:hypothetical protein
MRRAARWLTALSLLCATPALAGDPCAEGEAALADRSAEIKRLYDEAEADRPTRSAQATEVIERDEARLKLLLKMDKKGQLCTADDRWHAAWVMLNSTDVDDLERAYELAQETMAARHPRGAWLTGFAFDRWRTARGFNQSYGTQTRADNGKRCLITVEAEVTDEDRATYQQPPLADVYRRLLDANGFPEDEATYDRMDRRGLLCPPLAPRSGKRIAAPD